MLSDFTTIEHTFQRKDITIYPISDVHLGAAEHYEKEWRNFIELVKNEPDSYLMLGGDLMNNTTRSSVSNIFEETMRPRDQKILMTEMLTPVKDKILCAVGGNHERRSSKDADDNPMYDVMCKLNIESLYRENAAFVFLRFGNTKGNGLKNPSYSFCVTHGNGGGILTGASVNRAERFGYVIDGIDALIVGHTHKPFITQPSKIKVDPHNNKISLVPFKVISMSSWMSYGGYALQKMLIPSGFAPQTIKLCGTKKDITVEM